jgi:peptidoglycan/xylan/chitin deacetylase (PgdA/CDA1 family)
MQSLRDWGFQGIRLSELLDGWEGVSQLPSRPVVLTFDDGFRNLMDHAAPVLVDLDFRATVFVVAGHCGGTNDWSTDPHGIPRLPLLSWSDLGNLIGAGFEVGAHSMTHPSLPRLTLKDADREIAGSKEVLEQRVGQPVNVFAYPYGLASSENRAMAKAHYRAACGVGLGRTRPSDDRYCLRRIEMYYFRNPSIFRLFPTALGTTYLGLRAVGRTFKSVLPAFGRATGPR